MAPPKKSNTLRTRYLLRIDSELKGLAKQMAEADGINQNEFFEAAIRAHVRRATAEQVEVTMAPLIEKVIDDRLRVRLGSLRNYTGRLQAEIHRMQYILLYMLKNAGMPATHEEVLLEKGWSWAVERLADRPKIPRFDDEPTA